MLAPTAKVTRDAPAAVTGEGSSSWATPSSSRTWTARASSGWAEICRATSSASSGSTPRIRNVAASSSRSESGLYLSSCASLRTSASTSSFCEDTETNSPVAIENTPAARPASPVSTMNWCDPPPPPTPAISDTLVTRPSIAPNTAGRSQPPETSRCWCPCSSPRASLATLTVSFSGIAVPTRCGPPLFRARWPSSGVACQCRGGEALDVLAERAVGVDAADDAGQRVQQRAAAGRDRVRGQGDGPVGGQQLAGGDGVAVVDRLAQVLGGLPAERLHVLLPAGGLDQPHGRGQGQPAQRVHLTGRALVHGDQPGVRPGTGGELRRQPGDPGVEEPVDPRGGDLGRVGQGGGELIAVRREVEAVEARGADERAAEERR